MPPLKRIYLVYFWHCYWMDYQRRRYSSQDFSYGMIGNAHLCKCVDEGFPHVLLLRKWMFLIVRWRRIFANMIQKRLLVTKAGSYRTDDGGSMKWEISDAAPFPNNSNSG